MVYSRILHTVSCAIQLGPCHLSILYISSLHLLIPNPQSILPQGSLLYICVSVS